MLITYLSRRFSISIRAPLAGSDHRSHARHLQQNISIRAPLAGSDIAGCQALLLDEISIRAPLAGSDTKRPTASIIGSISIRAPLAGSDSAARSCGFLVLRFQSALPLRGATAHGTHTHSSFSQFQSALPLRGATAIFCSITLLSAKYCSFKDRRRKFIRQIPQNSSRTRYNVVRTSLVEHDRLWFATS